MNNGIINIIPKPYLSEIFRALRFAAFKHRHQKRKGSAGIPYIEHPIEVASMLIEYIENPSKEAIIAALLHDTLEDTDTTSDEIASLFGNKVSEIVNEVTDDMRLSSKERKKQQIIKADDLSAEARFIKIADKTCNIRDILTTRIYWSRKHKIGYITWAKELVMKICDAHQGLFEEFKKSIEEAEESLKYKFTSVP